MARMTKKAALALWEELRSSVVSLEATIKKVAETRAWEPLGYATFAEAWVANMKGTYLSSPRAAVHIVQLLGDSGLNVDEIYETIGAGNGISRGTIRNYQRQLSNGVPAAEVSVRSFTRSRPSAPSIVHVTLTPGRYADYKSLAEARGSTLEAEALTALTEHFKKLEQSRVRAA